MITFLRGNTSLLTVRPDTGSPYQTQIMGIDKLSVSFSVNREVGLDVGDYVIFDGYKYTINQLPPVDKESEFKYTYKFDLESEGAKLGEEQYFFLGDTNQLRETDFPLMGNIQTFADLLILNMNRVYPGIWSLGIIANSDYKNLTFSQDNCLSALGKIAQEFDTEYHIDGYVINIYKRNQNSGLTFQYGKGKGLYKISRQNKDNSNVITRLYAYGSDKNISSGYRNNAKKLMLPGGFYLEDNVSKYGIIEGVQVFDDIYPNRIGTVDGVDSADEFTFTDSLIDFDVNAQLIPGTTAKVVFNTGNLAGYQFDISSYNNSNKTFRINKNSDEKAFDIPSTVLRPAVGDQYVLIDIVMPQSYVDAAEALLQIKALDYLQANSSPNVNYVVECDPLFIRSQSTKPVLGDNVQIIDTDLGVNKQIRITSLSRDITLTDSYKIELADTTKAGIISRMITSQKQTAQILNTAKLTDPNRIRRNYKDTQELQNMVFDADGHYFSAKIKPLSIETTMLAVGARSQQFALNGVTFSPNLNGVAGDFGWTAGTLDHFNISALPVSWAITAGVNIGLVPASAYYIYARCAVAGSTGAIVLSTSAIIFNSDPAFYHFLIGVLHSELDGVRGISITYGQTTINGRYITTGRIQSNDGLTYFDLDNGVIGGAIQFGDNGTSTVVDGNLVTSGTIVLADGGTQKAGITGQGNLDSSVRIWAGASYANRAIAPFRITNDGHLYTVQGKIGNWSITENGFENNDAAGAVMHQLITYATDQVVETFIGTDLYGNNAGVTGSGYLASFVNTHAVTGRQNLGVMIDVRRGWWGVPMNLQTSPNIALDILNGDVRINMRDRGLDQYVRGYLRYVYDTAKAIRYVTLEENF